MRADNRSSARVALGGISCGLCLLLLFLTGMVPFSEYAMPAMAGVVLIAMVVEFSGRTAAVAYLAIAFLSVFLVPSKEAAAFFIFFFGHYPILKFKLDQVKPKLLGYLVKFLVFNVSVVLAGLVTIHLFGLTELLEDFGSFGRYSVLVLLGLGNVFFIFYDYMVGTLIDAYIHWFRPKILRKR